MRASFWWVVFGIIFLGFAFSSAGFAAGLSEERQTLELRIFGICPSCSGDVKSRVLDIPGVLDADVDLIRKKLFVTFGSRSVVNETKIIISLRQGGYEVRHPFREGRIERVALEVSGVKDKNDITEIERTFYAFYDVDRVEVSKRSDDLVAIVDFKKGGLDPGQLIISLKDSLPQVRVEIIPRRQMLEAQIGEEIKPQSVKRQ